MVTTKTLHGEPARPGDSKPDVIDATADMKRTPANKNVETLTAPTIPAPEKTITERSAQSVPDVLETNLHSELSASQVEKLALSDSQSTRTTLAQQDKFMVTLAPPTKGEDTHEEVTINGHMTRIQRGVPMQVAESVYQVLVTSGKVPPQRQEDVSLAPEKVITPFLRQVSA